MTKLSKSDLKKIKKLRDTGLSFRRIGKLFNVTGNAIYKRLKQLSPEKIDNKLT